MGDVLAQSAHVPTHPLDIQTMAPHRRVGDEEFLRRLQKAALLSLVNIFQVGHASLLKDVRFGSSSNVLDLGYDFLQLVGLASNVIGNAASPLSPKLLRQVSGPASSAKLGNRRSMVSK